MDGPFSGNPFYELKQLEKQIFSAHRSKLNKARIQRLRTLAAKCRRSNPDPVAICYHSALALIYEADGALNKAIRHREKEIALICLAHELELQNPTGGYALQNYGKKDLKDRVLRLQGLYKRKWAQSTRQERSGCA